MNSGYILPKMNSELEFHEPRQSKKVLGAGSKVQRFAKELRRGKTGGYMEDMSV